MTLGDDVVGQVFPVRLERPASGGAVGRAPDGRVVFVRHALPGEVVEATVTESTSTFYRADALVIVEPSPDRVSPPCRYAHPGGCGGCDLQHASREAQLSWKSAVVGEHLRRIAGVEREVTVVSAPSATPGSRTRLRCAVDSDGQLSLRVARSHDLVAVERCWISDSTFAEAFGHTWRGLVEVELRAIGHGQPFAVAQRANERGTTYEYRSMSGAPLEPTTSSRASVNGHVFSVGPLSFWQSHRDAPDLLTEAVMRMGDVRRGEDVVDLYGGVGLFTVPLAKVVGAHGRVTAVESSPFAVRDARVNATGLTNVRVREWSVTPRSVNDTVLPGSLVVVDPPRGGLGKGVPESLVRRAPRGIVYVSCDAATFARDLKIFLRSGYSLRQLEAIDLFPMTEHVELVAFLDSSSQKVDSASEAENLGSRPGG